MTVPVVVDVADEIVAALAVAGIRARSYVTAGEWNPPEVLVPMPTIRQRSMNAGVHELTYRLILVVADADDRAAHVNLGPLLTRTKTAIEADRTLGGTVAHVHVAQVVPDDEIRDRGTGAWFGAYLETTVVT